MSIRIPPLPISRSLVQFGAARADQNKRDASESAAVDDPMQGHHASRGQSSSPTSHGPSAAFLTHLIAVRLNADHLRARRRAGADYAVAAYATTALAAAVQIHRVTA